MGTQWEPGFLWGGLEGANKNKIDPKTSKLTKNQISFLTRKMSKYAQKKKNNFFARKGANRLGSITFV